MKTQTAKVHFTSKNTGPPLLLIFLFFVFLVFLIAFG